MENRGVVVAVTREVDHGQLVTLLRDADVFVSNPRPGSLTRHGLAFAPMHEMAPRKAKLRQVGRVDLIGDPELMFATRNLALVRELGAAAALFARWSRTEAPTCRRAAT